MKIQLAVDRVSIEKAIKIINHAKDSIDIIEIGTSLFKDYGLNSLKEINENFDLPILADIKTMDEAEYEFKQIFDNGGDIATVMGASESETIRKCQKISRLYNKDYMIDTLGVNDEKLKDLTKFKDAILCLHLPKDKGGDIQYFLENIVHKHNIENRIAVAGGVKKEDLDLFKKFGVEIVVVGSAITKSSNITQSAKEFKELL